jgi:maleate cis-trans isomerase
MWGWRGRIGLIIPGDFVYGPEFYSILPEGIALDVHTLGIERLVPEEIERIFNLFLLAAQHLASQECDVIFPTGSPILTYVGYDRGLELERKITASTGIPAILNLRADLDALRALSAKKIVIVTPYTEERTLERKKLCQDLGFQVLNTKCLGFEKRVEFGKQPFYASYRLARQAFFETPDADAVYISCPEWATVGNIQKLEDEIGKPVVTSTTSIIWAAFRAMHVNEHIKGYGRLLE